MPVSSALGFAEEPQLLSLSTLVVHAFVACSLDDNDGGSPGTFPFFFFFPEVPVAVSSKEGGALDDDDDDDDDVISASSSAPTRDMSLALSAESALCLL